MTEKEFFEKGFLAVDTEFVWMRTYYAQLGLVQFAAGNGLSAEAPELRELSPAAMPLPAHCAERSGLQLLLLAPERCRIAPVRALLEAPDTVKILHDAQQDLQHLVCWTGGRPKTIFDTRLAAGFCGLPSTISLAKLLENLLGIHLEKSETRTDWLHRPLTERQLEYAALDVVYMEAAVRELFGRAKALGTLDWMLEEMAALDDFSRYREPPAEDAWKRLKLPTAPFKNPVARVRIQEFAAWRERLARERNLVRKWIADDHFLIDAAIAPPKASALASVPKNLLFPAFRDSFEAVLAHCEKRLSAGAGNAAELGAWTDRFAPVDLAAHKAKVQTLAEKIQERAAEIHLDAALLGSRSDMSEFLLNPENPDHRFRNGWRGEVLSEVLKHV